LASSEIIPASVQRNSSPFETFPIQTNTHLFAALLWIPLCLCPEQVRKVYLRNAAQEETKSNEYREH